MSFGRVSTVLSEGSIEGRAESAAILLGLLVAESRRSGIEVLSLRVHGGDSAALAGGADIGLSGARRGTRLR